MESYSCEKTPGGGTPPSVSPDPSAPIVDYCAHVDAKGARCRMFPSNPDTILCAHHARKQVMGRRKEQAAVANALLRYVPDLSLAVSVNTFIGNVVRQYVLGHLDRKDAIAMGYLAQIAAGTLPAVDRQFAEERKVLAHLDWEKKVRESMPPAANESDADTVAQEVASAIRGDSADKHAA